MLEMIHEYPVKKKVGISLFSFGITKPPNTVSGNEYGPLTK